MIRLQRLRVEQKCHKYTTKLCRGGEVCQRYCIFTPQIGETIQLIGPWAYFSNGWEILNTN